MDSLTLQSIQDILAKNNSIGIVVGKNHSLDEMGAALALYLSLKNSGKQVSIASPSDPLVEVSSLIGVNKVKKSLDGDGGDLVVAFPYQEGEIEKVSYTLENGFLNIIVKAAEDGLSFGEKDVQFKKSGGLPYALFVVGTPRLSDLGALFDPEQLKNTTLINVDNKLENQGFGDVVLVSPEFSSVSEQIGHLLESLAYTIDIDVAQNLLSGISSGTDNFQSPKTSSLAFEMAAKLMQQGAKRQAVSNIKPFAGDQTFESRQQGETRLQRPQNQFPRAQRQTPRPFPRPQQFGQSPLNQPKPFGQSQNQNRPFGDAQGKPVQPQRPMPQFNLTQPQSQVQSNVQPQSTQPFGAAADKPEDEKQKDVNEKDAPPDWLTPKVYKGSTLV